MRRCFELALQSDNKVKTNPNVGALLVYNNHIISEGFHEYFGGNHAERNALENVQPSDKQFIPDSTLYVSLEPCNIESKTPPCSELILNAGIKKLVVSVSDPNPKIQGSSLQTLRNSGIDIVKDILSEEGHRVIHPFKVQLTKRPYVILKYAQSSDGYIGKKDSRVFLSNEFVNRKVHLWRSMVDGILIGYNTALTDNPKLTTRLVPGRSPIRIVIDRDLSLPETLHLNTDDEKTIFITNKDRNFEPINSNKMLIRIEEGNDYLRKLLKALFDKGVYRLIVEGGAKTLNSFIDQSIWDEARVITTPNILGKGIRAPFLTKVPEKEELIHDNKISYHFND